MSACTVATRIADALGPVSAPYDEKIAGGRVHGVWLGQPSVVQFEVCELLVESEPSLATMRAAWRKRRSTRARPLIVFWQGPDDVLLTEPTGEPEVTVLTVSLAVALTVLQQALAAPRGEAVPTAVALLERAQGTAGIAGFRNRNLLSTHYVTRGFQRNESRRWVELSSEGARLHKEVGAKLLRALGYTATTATAFEVSHSGKTRVHAMALPGGTALDRSVAGPGGSPTTRLLIQANAKGAERAVIISGRLLRIYVADATKGLDDVATASNYIEIDLEILDDSFIGLLPMLFAADSHAVGGLFDKLVEQSSRYAVALRERFRERIYSNVVGDLARALYAAGGRGNIDPNLLYQATLRMLYRLLFVLYAEDRNLLPLGNSEYRRVSLTQTLFRLENHMRSGLQFDPKQTTFWEDLFRIFTAIRSGNVEWNVPGYNGGLFEPALDDHPEAAYLQSIKLPNDVLAPILLSLGFDEQHGHRGKVDFGDLGVRHLGTLYEGLLSFSIRVADIPLTVDDDGLYVPAQTTDTPLVGAGEIYVTSPKGGRKASGSHYTPTFVVRRLLVNALEPVLERHLATVALKPASERWEAMLAIHVVDPAMGSGHFLVDALDVIANRLARYLAEDTRIDASPVTAARKQITSIGKAYGIEGLGDTIGDFEILRRIVMRNCVYGVDLNPMAVELAKLSLWLHAFVPGLPLSYLGHNLRHGNALVGVIGPEIADKTGGGLFGGAVSVALADALDHAKQLAALSDLSLDEVKNSEDAQLALETATEPITDAFDAYSCRAFARNDELTIKAERGSGRAILEFGDGLLQVLKRDVRGEEKRQIASAQGVARTLDAFHWQLAFPEVFLRENPGFDVVLGNPPWEELNVERLGYYALYIPGLKSFASAVDQERYIKSYECSHPDIEAQYQAEIALKKQLQVIAQTNYSLTSGGNRDLYRIFAELSLRIVRKQGAIGMVYPRTLLSGDGASPFRERLFGESSVIADFAQNGAGWVFADAEPRYTVVALSAISDGGMVLDAGGPATSEKAWQRLPSERIHWTYKELKKVAPGLEVPLSHNPSTAELFHKVVVNGQPFEDEIDGVRFSAWAPFNATTDRQNGTLKQRSPQIKGWPVIGGRNFNLWQPELGESALILDEATGLDILQRKRLRSIVWTNFAQELLRDIKTLPQLRPHIAFRDVARRDDSRTVIAALLPPGRFTLNNAPILIKQGGSEVDVALRLGIMCSLTFDWIARRRVESHLSIFILKTLPVPRTSISSNKGARVAQLAASLASIDERFADFAIENSVDCGVVSEEKKQGMLAEIDATVAAMYGLNAEDLEIVFSDFTTDAVPLARREQTRNYFMRIVAGAEA